MSNPNKQGNWKDGKERPRNISAKLWRLWLMLASFEASCIFNPLKPTNQTGTNLMKTFLNKTIIALQYFIILLLIANVINIAFKYLA
jgi:hypothetical protein